MDILILLKKHKQKLENIKDIEELDKLVHQLQSISDEDIKNILNKESIEIIFNLINEITAKIEELKQESINEMKLSKDKLEVAKAYLKNI